MTCPLEADTGKCKVLLTEAAFICFTSAEEEIPNSPPDEPANPPTDKRQDEAIKEMPTELPKEEGDNPQEEGDKPNDDPEGGALGSPDRMDTRNDTAINEEGSTMKDNQSDEDLETVDSTDSEADAVEKHRKAVMSDDDLDLSSDSDLEDGDAHVRDQLLIVNEKLDKDKRRGSGCEDTMTNDVTLAAEKPATVALQTSDHCWGKGRPAPSLATRLTPLIMRHTWPSWKSWQMSGW